MPYYVHACEEHGPVEVHRPMLEAGWPIDCPTCGGPMRRVYFQIATIVRPGGWQLRPGDKGYWDFDRQRELGELRDGSHESAVGKVKDPETPRPTVKYTEDDLYELNQMGQVWDRAIRDSPYIEKG